MPNQPIDLDVDPSTANLVSPGLQGPSRVSGSGGYNPPNAGSLVDLPAGMLWGWGCSVAYVTDMGLRGVPPAGSPGTVLMGMVRVHTGFTYKVVSWVAQALLVTPPIPKATSVNPNEVLFARTISPSIPGKLQDGTPVWTVTGSMTYLLQAMLGENDSIEVGSTPFGIEPAAMNRLDPAMFSQYLGSAQVSGFNGPLGASPITY